MTQYTQNISFGQSEILGVKKRIRKRLPKIIMGEVMGIVRDLLSGLYKTPRRFPAIPMVSVQINDDILHRKLIAQKVNTMLQGHLNVQGNITLNAKSTTTTIHDPRLNGFRNIHLIALTPNAMAAQIAGIYFSDFDKGQVVINHSNLAFSDMYFSYSVLG